MAVQRYPIPAVLSGDNLRLVDLDGRFLGVSLDRDRVLGDDHPAFESDFEAECARCLSTIAGYGEVARTELVRALRCSAAEFNLVIDTLIERGAVDATRIRTRTKPITMYRLAEESDRRTPAGDPDLSSTSSAR